MPCCGNKRARSRRKARASSATKRVERAAAQVRPGSGFPPYFQYVGKTGLTLMGPRSHKLYRFDRPGAIVAVDPRDGRALDAVSVLERVAKPA
jgi:hypothetical protein